MGIKQSRYVNVSDPAYRAAQSAEEAAESATAAAQSAASAASSASQASTSANQATNQAAAAATSAGSAATSEANAAQSESNAQQYANDAEGFANDAEEYALIAKTSANFQGLWSDATGAATRGWSYEHEGALWMLRVNVANIAATEPSISSSNWYREQGTAATYDVTESTTDTSNGGNSQPRLMRVGDFGVGSVIVSAVTDLDNLTDNGLFQFDNNPSNRPSGISSGTFFECRVSNWTQRNLIIQEITVYGALETHRKYLRRRISGVWSTWQEMLHTGNTGSIDPSTSTTNTTSFNHTSTGAVQSMRSAGVQVGSITVTGSATSYNTSSDYRLKEDWQAIENASDRLLSLNPVNFKWKSSEDRADGFLAHELQEVIPEAVTGEKDEVELIISTDEDGNEIEIETPKHQAIDQSKIVPLLTAALQDALKRIEVLEAKTGD